LGRSPGAISEEIRNNSVNGEYNAGKADHKAYLKRKYSKYQGMKIARDRELRGYVEGKLKQDWSPEQISGRLREVDTHIKYAGFKGIYKFLYSPYGRQLEKHLRHRRNKRKGCRNKAFKLENRAFIDQRPDIINNRARYGDWEGDFIVSGKLGKGLLLVLYERRSKYVIIKRIMTRNCNAINQYIHDMLGIFICFHSLTIDNDIYFRKHEELSNLLGVPVYFCHPYHSWEKGGVENINKLIRQYIPKRSDISKYTDEYIKEIEVKLNSRPRKGLGYKTPLEIMAENSQFKALEDFGIINKQKTPVAGVRLEGVT